VSYVVVDINREKSAHCYNSEDIKELNKVYKVKRFCLVTLYTNTRMQ